jgi:hypothetical protein
VLLVVAVAAVVALAGCSAGERSSSASPSPQLGPVAPTAVAYPSVQALWKAVANAGSPKVQPWHFTSPFSRLPSASEYGSALVATPGGMVTLRSGEPASNVLGASFPDAVPARECDHFYSWLVGSDGWTSYWRLQGPNWILWDLRPDALREVRLAIGGELAQESVSTAANQ